MAAVTDPGPFDGTGMYGTEVDGSSILTIAGGICPPHGPIAHTCDEAAGLQLIRWWTPAELLDADGNCRFCGERI